MWIVTINYDTTTKERDEDPLKRPYEMSWSFAQFTKVIYKDRDGEVVTNSARQEFDPPIEVDDSRPVLSISRNEQSFNPTLAIEYKDAVNSDRFFGFAAKQAKVANIQATQADENGKVFWKVSYEFHFRREGWDPLEVLDVGRYEFVNGKHVPIREFTVAGVEIPESHVSDPVPLDGNGRRLNNPNPGNVHYVPIKAYPLKPFRRFNF